MTKKIFDPADWLKKPVIQRVKQPIKQYAPHVTPSTPSSTPNVTPPLTPLTPSLTSDVAQANEMYTNNNSIESYISAIEQSSLDITGNYACLLYTSPSPRDS